MSYDYRACTRCGIKRMVKPERDPGVCLDCRLVEGDLARMRRPVAEHGTEAGYFAHVKHRHGWPKTACTPCLEAHRVAEHIRNRGRGVRPKAEAMREVHAMRPQRRENGRWVA